MLKRKDIINRFSDKGYTKKAAGFVIDDFVETLTEMMSEGESIMLHGFGTFKVREMAGHESTAVKTGDKIFIPSYKMPKFVPSKRLKLIVKDGRMYDRVDE